MKFCLIRSMRLVCLVLSGFFSMTRLVVLVLALAWFIPGHAAITVTPTVDGLARNAVTGNYLNNRAGQLQFLFDDAARRYGASSTVTVAGKSIPLPAKVPLRQGAAAIVRGAIFANPTRLAGTAALSLLTSAGLVVIADQWMKQLPPPGDYPLNSYQAVNITPGCHGDTGPYWHAAVGQYKLLSVRYQGQAHPAGYTVTNTFQNVQCVATGQYAQYSIAFKVTSAPSNQPVPATILDFNVIPDVLPTDIAQELPGASYMEPSGGAPVDEPLFDPADLPIGDPYVRPDGTTVQPWAKITPASNGQVTIDTYDKPILDAQGNPIADPTPIDTAEPNDPCTLNPSSVACAELDLPEHVDVPRETVDLVYTPEDSPISGSCPAPISLPLGQSLSFDAACGAMDMIKPIVLAICGFVTMMIMLGGVRE